MATELILAALKQVRAARDAANVARTDTAASCAARALAARAFMDLDKLEGDLILRGLDDQLVDVQRAAGDLKSLLQPMRDAQSSLGQLAGLVDGVAAAVDALAQISGLASGEGPG
jgi:hypothetical protein